MFGSSILEVAIGLILIFLLLSLIASAVQEAIESVIRFRGVHLERGILELLGDGKGTGLARTFYEHPLICSLYRGSYKLPGKDKKRSYGGNLPAYIPARSFAVALIDIATRGPDAGPYAAYQTSPSMTDAGLRASVQRIPNVFVQRAMLSAIDHARGDLALLQKNLEAWYDSAMDRVSGSYKRRTQRWLFGIGLGLALTLNVNTLTVADYLATEPAARTALVSRAQEILQDSTYRQLVDDSVVTRVAGRAVYEDLQSLSLPIGWDRRLPPPPGSEVGYWVRQVMGLLLTVLAITLGAPFWFDLLNKVMVIRSTVKPREKSSEEGSEDRQPKGGESDGDAALAAGIATFAGASSAVGSEAGGAPGVSRGSTPPRIVPAHTDQEWADDIEDGII